MPISFKNATIKGITACVPPSVIDNKNFSPVYSEKDAKKVIRATGIKERRFADDQTCASDLCVAAADKLLTDLNIPRDSIDVLIFESQTPDYLCIPATACILQDRLGLDKSTGAFDMSLGCSGFIYGLSTAFSYAAAARCRVLLLVGDTLSKILSPEDRTTSLLFGDAGIAMLIDGTSTDSESFFTLNTDGSGYDAIQIKAGGYRNQSSEETLIIKKYDDGSRRNDHHCVMNGVQVFDFTMREVVADIKALLEFSGGEIEEIDQVVFHQANHMMINMFAKKLKIPNGKVPISIDRFGNTSTTSIPLTMVSELGQDKAVSGKFLMSGYGAGLSWGSCLLDLEQCYIGKLFNFEQG